MVVTGDRAETMKSAALEASQMMKTLSHPVRLLLICQILDGEKSVNRLVDSLELKQASVSQQLARLREEGLVTTRRESQAIYYSVSDEKVKRLIGMIYEIFCSKADDE